MPYLIRIASWKNEEIVGKETQETFNIWSQWCRDITSATKNTQETFNIWSETWHDEWKDIDKDDNNDNYI